MSIVFAAPTLIYSDTEDITLTTSRNDINESEQEQPISTTTIGPTTVIGNMGFNYNHYSSNLTDLSFAAKSSSLLNTEHRISSQISASQSSASDRITLTLTSNKIIIVRTLCIMRWPDGVSGFSTYEFL